jgi:SAM-dependent methyltransferase
MHDSSYKLMDSLLRKHLSGASGTVVDFGSYDVNGTYRPLFGNAWKYLGADIEAGKNVDIVMRPYEAPLESDSIDLVVSGQAIEHCSNPFKFVKEMARVLKSGCQIILIAPWRWCVHRYPIDCWRFLPDGMACLFDEAGIIMVDSQIVVDDCYAVGVKK